MWFSLILSNMFKEKEIPIDFIKIASDVESNKASQAHSA